MAEPLRNRILTHLRSEEYRPQQPEGLAEQLQLTEGQKYHAFRDALRELMHEGRVVLGLRGAVMLPTQTESRDEFTGTYRHNKRGFGFVVPTDPGSREDLFIPEGQNNGAITGDIVRAKITSRGQKDGKAMYSGRITEIVERTQKKFVGSLVKTGHEWTVLPDGNTFTTPILTPDAASRHIKPGTKVVVELTSYPDDNTRAQGVITEILGKAGEKDVDLRSVIVQFNLPDKFPEAVAAEARQAIDAFNPEEERGHRLDLTGELICTIDPDDAKDYDDAISLRQLPNGNWELGVHIADVSHFVPSGSALDEEAHSRGNSCYFPGFVIPMLPEILSNGVCSLQEGVPRLCKSAFITYNEDAQPVGTKFHNTVIKSAKRLRYREAQAILDNAEVIPHPEGARSVADYPAEVVELLHQMNDLAKRLQKRRVAQGQINLDLPEVELILDEEGKVIDAVPEDTSFTHTLIEMFMVEANEAVARLLDSMGLPFLRRVHPEPEITNAERLRTFVQVSGFKLPKQLDRKAIQALLQHVRGKPEGFAVNLAVLRSLTRAEYSPEPVGHYALASEHYCHFTSPIRRYADLTIHRLLDAFFEARDRTPHGGARGSRKKVKIDPDKIPSYDELLEIGRHISFTERRAADAERELRQIKLLELLKDKIGEVFSGVVTGITNFGVFVQIQAYLVDGLIRYENLMDDWWTVDEKAGVIRGERTGTKIGIGDVVKTYVVRVDVPRRELDLAISEVIGRARRGATGESTGAPTPAPQHARHKKHKGAPPQQRHKGARPTGIARNPHPQKKKGGGGRRRRR
ncbi:MAG: rnr [Phycisphaerales bacterium]|nr:rnr [Phycisphaerales bacterium]